VTLPISCILLKAEAYDGMNTEFELEKEKEKRFFHNCRNVSLQV